MRPEDLTLFETEVAALFNAGRIPFPVHLESGNEEDLIRVFETIEPHDWVLCSWRSHLKCLLKGVPREEVLAAIMAGESMTLCFPEYRILSSAIVGGVVPIAVGIAAGIARSGGTERVHCFMGDMTMKTGIAHECMEYGRGLPIRWIVEDNELSVCTPTPEVWPQMGRLEIVGYRYKSRYPHAGAGVRVQF